MTGVARRTIAAALVLAIGLIAGLGMYVAHTQSEARGVLRHELAQRARLTASLVGQALVSDSTTKQAKADFGGARASPGAVVRSYGEDGNLTRVYVLDAEGRVLASSGHLPPDAARAPHVRAALAGRPSVSDALEPGGKPQFE